MHIPDGFISPSTFITAWGGAGALLFYATKRADIDSEKITFLASLSALSFVFMMVAIPLPGGTSAHLSGVALLALIFGPWNTFLAISLVLAVEAFLFAEGGVTTLGVNILAISFIGSFSAYYTYRLLRKVNEKAAVMSGAFLSVTLPALFIAAVLGVQPLVASISGEPMFFPFDFKTTAIALLVPHLIIGVIEGLVTLAIYTFLKKSFPVLFHER